MGKSLMVQGTASNVGKSIITAGILRVLKEDGYNVAPFKSQNMALNSYITKEGLEMGRAQVVQAEAAGKDPEVLMNPVLLKPSTDKKAQVIVMGKVFKNMSAVEYHDFKVQLKDKVLDAYKALEDKNDFVVIEGAGSPAEINLRDKDIVNMGMAELSDSPVILVGDIDKGGVFASIYGTIMLLDPSERSRIKGVVINKFRGDKSILQSGLDMLEDLTGVPVIGVVPYSDLQIEDEDSLTSRFKKNVSQEGKINVEILYLPHVSNFTDFNIFETQEDVNVRYVMRGETFDNPDIIIIPGSKNTIEDLIYLKNSGLSDEIIRQCRKGTVIFGVCGGYQILGNTIKDPYKTESLVDEINGLGILDIDTVFEKEKTTTQVEGEVVFAGENMKSLEGLKVSGYEIHMGITKHGQSAKEFLKFTNSLGQNIDILDGAVNEEGNVFGTYLHGVFDSLEFTRSLLNLIRERKGMDSVESSVKSFKDFKEREYDKLAKLIRENIDMDKVYEIMKGE
ncbi:MAG: cobyric acid synthase [Firmicutes bacterium]|jgi:adenosylcobyric acid synthase|nr:cobyric acid synthase [Bacillota bacterium]